jgi:hypothetical protein
MSEALELLQQLAQKPSVRAWFMEAFFQVHIKLTDTGEELTILNQGTSVEVLSGFHVPKRKHKGLAARLGFDPGGWYARQFIVPLETQNIRNLVVVFSDDVVDIEEQYRIVSFMNQAMLRAELAMPVFRNPLLLRLLRVDPFWQQALLNPQGQETQQITVRLVDNQWVISPGYQGQPKHRYLLKPENIMAFQRRAHQAEQEDTLSGWLAALRWFWSWRESITVAA